MSEHETHADIVAEMRKYKDLVIKGRNYPDRLEAAHERELQNALDTGGYVEAAGKARRSGDAAKLREACANIAEYARSAQCHTEDAHVLGYLNQIEGWAKAALAAPVRNCERFRTWEEAKTAYWSEQGDPSDWRKLGKWLFAQVKESEAAE